MDSDVRISCLEKRMRELETGLAVSRTQQQNHEIKLDDFTETTTLIIEKQSASIETLKKYMYLATGVIMALQALDIIK